MDLIGCKYQMKCVNKVLHGRNWHYCFFFLRACINYTVPKKLILKITPCSSLRQQYIYKLIEILKFKLIRLLQKFLLIPVIFTMIFNL